MRIRTSCPHTDQWNPLSSHLRALNLPLSSRRSIQPHARVPLSTSRLVCAPTVIFQLRALSIPHWRFSSHARCGGGLKGMCALLKRKGLRRGGCEWVEGHGINAHEHGSHSCCASQSSHSTDPKVSNELSGVTAPHGLCLGKSRPPGVSHPSRPHHSTRRCTPAAAE